MTTTRIVRLLYVGLINGVVLVQLVKLSAAALKSHDRTQLLGAAVLIVAAIFGVWLELKHASYARVVNVSVIAIIALVMLGIVGYLRFVVREPEASQAAALFLLLSVIPIALTGLTLLVYRMTTE